MSTARRSITGQQQRADRQRRWEEEDALGQEERRSRQRGAVHYSLFFQKFSNDENDVFTYTVVFSLGTELSRSRIGWTAGG